MSSAHTQPALTLETQPDPRYAIEKVDVFPADEEEEKDPDEKDLLHGVKLSLAFGAMLLSIFLVALDGTIVATAAPVISSKFNALDKITWVITGFVFTQTAFVLPFGQYLVIWPTKWVYLMSIFIFELGSLFCAIAQSIDFLIFGRAVAGIGGAGIFVSIFTLITEITRLKDRPALFGLFGGVFGVSSVVGPLIGGALTDNVSWRWCFYINLPIGGLSILAIFLLIEARPAISDRHKGKIPSALEKIRRLDIVGTVLSLAAICCFLLALQWGGNERPWNSASVIALICLSPVIFLFFIAWEHRVGDNAMMPLVLFKRKTQWGASLAASFAFCNMFLAVYYLPIYFQAARHHSAARSGIDIIPYMLSMVLCLIASGIFVKRVGHYWSFILLGPLSAAAGAALLFTIDEHTSLARLIGYQILFGVGVGLVMQSYGIALMADVPSRKMIPQAMAVASFFQRVGGTVGVAIAGAVFDNELVRKLKQYAPQVNPTPIRRSLTAIYTIVPPQYRGAVIHAYAKALDHVFLIGIAASVLGSLCAFLVANHNIVKMDEARQERIKAKAKVDEEISDRGLEDGSDGKTEKVEC